MREILYRGKRVGNGEWIYGYYLEEYRKDKTKKSCIFGSWTDGEKVFNHKEMVIPETVGQYTGLTDKNGKKIFEGDIVDILTENEERGVITYNDGCFIVEADGFVLTFIDHLYGTDVEVIGNKWDNPELLRGEEL